MSSFLEKAVKKIRNLLIASLLRLVWLLTEVSPTAVTQNLISVWYRVVDRNRGADYELRQPVIFVAMPKSASKTIALRIASMLHTEVMLIADKQGEGVWPSNTKLDMKRFLFALFTKKIMHEHCRADNVTLRQFRKVTDHIIVHVRDPRQVLVSMAHHFLTAGEDLYRFGIDTDKIDGKDWEGTIDYLIDNAFPELVRYINEWVQFSKSGQVKVSFFTYEYFHQDSEKYFSELMRVMGLSNYASMPEVSQHLREGKTAEWRQVLTDQQQLRLTAVLPVDLIEKFNWDRS